MKTWHTIFCIGTRLYKTENALDCLVMYCQPRFTIRAIGIQLALMCFHLLLARTTHLMLLVLRN